MKWWLSPPAPGLSRAAASIWATLAPLEPPFAEQAHCLLDGPAWPLNQAVSGLFALLIATRRWRDAAPAAAAITGITGLIACPVSGTHHWHWALPTLLALARTPPATVRPPPRGWLLFAIAPCGSPLPRHTGQTGWPEHPGRPTASCSPDWLT
jgi:hypothetical protein